MKEKELKELFEWLISDLYEGLGDIDGCDLQDKLESLGLLVKVKIPKEKQKDYPACSEYDTDELLFAWDSEELKTLKE